MTTNFTNFTNEGLSRRSNPGFETALHPFVPFVKFVENNLRP